MTKFEEKANKIASELGYNCFRDLIGDDEETDKIMAEFADWQPQQALPVVPECVGEYIEQSKGNLSLYGALYGIVKETDTELHKWASEKGNRDIFARAWLDGFTVEKPQLFRVCLLGGRHTLTRCDPRKTLPFNYTFLWSYSSELKEMREINKEVDLFTEEEIKSIDERYWQFAVPVEDGE